MIQGVKLNGWIRVYLIFGLLSFLLGFLGYLGTEPPAVSQRFAERWADFSSRFPVLADLNWLNRTAPAFTQFETPTVLLLTPEPGGEPAETGFAAEFAAKLEPYAPNIIRIPFNPGGGTPFLDNVTPLYRKFFLIGMQDEAPSRGNSRLTVGAPAYLASGLFAKLAAALPANLGQFDWERANIANGVMITVQWRDDPDRAEAQARTKRIVALCLTLFEAERTMADRGFEL